MKVLIVGGGGREHALAWKVHQSPLSSHLYAAPGNPGMAQIATCVPIAADDVDALVQFAVNEHISFVIVGPEVALCLGLVDRLQAKGIKAFGPHEAAARLEGSKAFAKAFMKKHQIPTAKHQDFTDPLEAIKALPSFGLPVVIKADGLAAGKGVIIAHKATEAVKAIQDIMDKKTFGQAGNRLVLEEFLTGVEASQLCFVDGNTLVPLESAQDYKRAFDDDQGPNTGGMGTYSPSHLYHSALQTTIKETILDPFLQGLQKDQITYQGLVFIGLMIENDSAKVIEFNVRFGDPETQSLMVRLESDLLDVMLKTVDKRLDEVSLKWSPDHAVCVVMASGGYPESYKKGLEIKGLDHVRDALVFHAGTAFKDEKVVTNGGRVLSVVAKGPTQESARLQAYQALEQIHYKDMFFRSDIGK